MKITIEKSALFKALNHVQSVVERRTTIPILANVLIEEVHDGLKLTATDLDIEVVEHIDATSTNAAAITVPASILYDIVRKMPDGAQIQMELDQDQGRLFVHSNRSRFTLPTLPPQDFPSLSVGEFDARFDMPVEHLIDLIDGTKFAISTEETRYYLNGIYLHAMAANDQDCLRAVATDGHRLARLEIAAPAGSEAMPSVIVPRKAILEVRRLLDSTEGTVRVEVSRSRIRFTLSTTVLTSKLIDGSFPDYERVIPADNDKQLVLDCESFSRAVDRVSTIATEKSRAVKMNLEGENLTLTVVNPDTGTAAEELVVSYADEPLEIGFNSRYLLDVMAQIKGSEARLLLKDSASPTIISDAKEETQSALYVLMPMRV